MFTYLPRALQGLIASLSSRLPRERQANSNKRELRLSTDAVSTLQFISHVNPTATPRQNMTGLLKAELS